MLNRTGADDLNDGSPGPVIMLLMTTTVDGTLRHAAIAPALKKAFSLPPRPKEAISTLFAWWGAVRNRTGIRKRVTVRHDATDAALRALHRHSQSIDACLFPGKADQEGSAGTSFYGGDSYPTGTRDSATQARQVEYRVA